ncbi:MAG: GNAT family N-acetyltransferase [Endomicrobium sp.]|jgi:putative acetyltransferase|nr:GNAT family N-acetyltransferase [Endomicrobium sp.]
MKIEQLKKQDYESVLILWEKSVKVSHTFLKEQDFNIIKNAVMLSFKNISLYGIKRNCKLCGFVGTSHNQIEALFVDPSYFGQGLGKKLVAYAIKELNLKKVCVNEQNKKAYTFYGKMGFKFVSRDEFDFLNLHYPILHLELQK